MLRRDMFWILGVLLLVSSGYWKFLLSYAKRGILEEAAVLLFVDIPQILHILLDFVSLLIV